MSVEMNFQAARTVEALGTEGAAIFAGGGLSREGAHLARWILVFDRLCGVLEHLSGSLRGRCMRGVVAAATAGGA